MWARNPPPRFTRSPGDGAVAVGLGRHSKRDIVAQWNQKARECWPASLCCVVLQLFHPRETLSASHICPLRKGPAPAKSGGCLQTLRGALWSFLAIYFCWSYVPLIKPGTALQKPLIHIKEVRSPRWKQTEGLDPDQHCLNTKSSPQWEATAFGQESGKHQMDFLYFFFH